MKKEDVINDVECGADVKETEAVEDDLVTDCRDQFIVQ